MDPLTIALITSAISAGAGAAGSHIAKRNAENAEKKKTKYRTKEAKRETHAGLLQDEMRREAENKAHRMGQSAKHAKRKASHAQNTADLVREALNI